MSDSDRAINAKHCINVIGYSAGISTSNGRSGDIRGIETLLMLHSQRHAALAIAATAQVRFVPQPASSNNARRMFTMAYHRLFGHLYSPVSRLWAQPSGEVECHFALCCKRPLQRDLSCWNRAVAPTVNTYGSLS